MIKLSIVIVNYNVQYFLEYCIRSVYQNNVNFNYEIIVVDNASKDESVAMLQKHFPDVKVIINIENVGFAKANNQAIDIAQGEYVLLLNPDTLLQEDTLQISIDTIEKDNKIGALGVKMLDGSGNFLPESKRGFPSPSAAFYKLSGLANLFPSSSIFGKYHLSYLNKHQNHEVDVLSGAFMLIRKNVLLSVGKLDEQYFMYGEDIDLSYQIKKAGYKNFYLADTNIIHFKGESTKKGSLNYIKLFYGAMLLFAKKNLSKKQANVLQPFIKLGIYVQGFLAFLKQLINRIFFPMIDFGLIFFILYELKHIFENYIKIDEKLTYPNSFLYFNIPFYSLVFIIALYLMKNYNAKVTWKKTIAGLFFGFILISIAYSFFPLNLRSSRAIIICSFVCNMPMLILYRILINKITPILPNYLNTTKRYAIFCNDDEIQNIQNTINLNLKNSIYVGYINNQINKEQKYLGTQNQIQDIIKAYQITDIIFSIQSMEMKNIIQIMNVTSVFNLHYRMYNQAQNIISSKNKNTKGEIWQLDINTHQSKNFFDKISNWFV